MPPTILLTTPLLFSSIDLTEKLYRMGIDNETVVFSTDDEILENSIAGTLVSAIFYRLNLSLGLYARFYQIPLKIPSEAIQALCKSPNFTTLDLYNTSFPITMSPCKAVEAVHSWMSNLPYSTFWCNDALRHMRPTLHHIPTTSPPFFCFEFYVNPHIFYGFW